MAMHYTAGSRQSRVLTDDLIDEFCVAGPAGLCIDRLCQFMDMGVTKIFVLRPGRGVDPDIHAEADRALVEGVVAVMA
jgi:hypothetical protein